MERFITFCVFVVLLLRIPANAAPQSLPMSAPHLHPPATAAEAGLSDYLLFHFFFEHVVAVEAAADRLRAAGKSSSSAAARSHFKNIAKLTETEASLMKEIAQNCHDDYAAANKSLAASVKSIGAQYPPGTPKPAAATQQLADLENQREQVVTGYMQRLQSGMGAARFQKFYSFVLNTEAPRIHHRTLPAPPPRPAAQPSK